MGLFTRRTRPVDANTTTATGTGPTTAPHTEKTGRHSIMNKRDRNHAAPMAGTLSTRPTFGQWIKGTWIDILTMACMGAIGLGVSDQAASGSIQRLTWSGLQRSAGAFPFVPSHLP